MTNWWSYNGKKRAPIGEPKRTQVRAEEAFYPTFEDLLRAHRLEWWHNTVAQRSQPGWPDYSVFGDGWLAFVELKARQVSGRAGKVSEAQRRYQRAIERAGGEWKSFLLPDQWHDVDIWLNGHTGRDIWEHGIRLTEATG